eukprot:3308170-Amphidinium_carterae.1
MQGLPEVATVPVSLTEEEQPHLPVTVGPNVEPENESNGESVSVPLGQVDTEDVPEVDSRQVEISPTRERSRSRHTEREPEATTTQNVSQPARAWTEMTEPVEPPWRRQRREQEAREMMPLFRGASTLTPTPRAQSPRNFVGSVVTPQKMAQTREPGQAIAAGDQLLKKGIVKPEQLRNEFADLFLQGSRLKEAETVLPSMEPVTDQALRVIFSRWLDTLKAVDETADQQKADHKQVGVPVGLVAKSRLILQGYTDPDYEQLECEVPAAEVGDITMTLQLFATHECEAFIADIKGAFNQAASGQRGEALYVLLPEGYPMWSGVRLAKLVKELYGLLAGPASWRYTLLNEAKRLGFVKHGTCPCLLCYPECMNVDDDGRFTHTHVSDHGDKGVQSSDQLHTMGGWILVQTDDLLMGGNGKGFQKAQGELQRSFTFGKWQSLKGETCTFNGRQLTQNGNYEFSYDMTLFVKKIMPVQIDKSRKKVDACTETEVSAYRKLLGSLLWAARGSLPQILGDLSLLANRINTLTVESLHYLNKTLKRAQELSCPLWIFSIPPKQLMWISWSDASLANQDGGTTQTAHLIGATSRNILTDGKGTTSVLHYASKKMKRVASSTLMTEACALTSCLSELEWWIEWWSSANDLQHKLNMSPQGMAAREIPTPPIDRRLRTADIVQGVCIVDSKSLYDIVNKAVSAGQCKKAALEALTASDTIQLRGLRLRWQPHEWNVSDPMSGPMTKLHGNAEPLMKLIRSGLAQLLPEHTHLENRAVEREELGYNTRAKRHSAAALRNAE